MNTVSRFEANLLHILRYFLGKEPASQVVPLIDKPLAAPPCLSRAAVELIEDTIAKGCVLRLAHAHAWRRERFLRDGRVAEGRLWERRAPEALGLSFTRHALRFLMWVTAAKLPSKPRAQPPADELAVGDWLLVYYAFAALRQLPAGQHLLRQTPFARNPLCRLAFPEDFVGLAPEIVPDFDRWTFGVGACVLEALQGEFRGRWVEVEHAKARMTVWRELRGLGQAQERILTAFLTAVEAAGRRDLARFVLEALGVLFGGAGNPFAWLEGLDPTGERLADRMDTHHAVLVLPRQLARLDAWDQWARGIGYFDEDYAASQLWKADWEQARGEELCRRASQTNPGGGWRVEV